MLHNPKAYGTCQVGVVLRRTPGVTRWQKWSWSVSAVLPGAGPSDWRVLRRDGDTTDFHATTVAMDLHGADTEAYLHGLQAQVPCLYVVMRDVGGEYPLDVVLVTASPYEAQDYTDSGEEIVEKISMPPVIRGWIEDFIETHHQEEAFIKRRRDKKRVDLVQDGIGDARVAKAADIYASPSQLRRRVH
ncbi:MAG: DUF3305 domain-containing protein [Pseudomonadota bacterium]